MVRIAVSGGTNGVGRAIVDAIIGSKKHELFVLTREKSEKSHIIAGATILPIDYSSVDGIADLLKVNLIDTVISAVTLQNPDSAKSQTNLIEGAAKSGTVRRFAPSEFGLDYAEAGRRNYPFPGIEFRNTAVEQLKTFPALKYTRFVNGTFMDYLGTSGSPTHINMVQLILDLENNKAVIPGKGNTPVVFTHTTTIGAFVTAALDLKDWPEESFIKGDRATLNELVAIAEKVKGVKFDVTYDTIDDLKAGKNTGLPSNVPRYAYLPKQMVDMITQISGIAAEDGRVDLEGPFLNDVLPEVKALSLEAFFTKSLEGN